VNLCIATTNDGKFKEIKDFLKEKFPHLQICSLKDFENIPEVKETGSSFFENATIKAKAFSSFLRIPCLADDSGLEVDALGGRPGVFSARFAGLEATDEENCTKLIQKLKNTKESERTAAFRCAMVLQNPKNQTIHSMGELKGIILSQPKGSEGFGYDPLFYVPELKRTLAELSLKEKNQISHRSKALERLAKLMEVSFFSS